MLLGTLLSGAVLEASLSDAFLEASLTLGFSDSTMQSTIVFVILLEMGGV